MLIIQLSPHATLTDGKSLELHHEGSFAVRTPVFFPLVT